jgi:molybdenum cofactor cytidylyltransferase
MDDRKQEDKIAGIVMGAGLSRRMRGRNKLLVLMGGMPAIARICSVALSTELSPLVVVLGHEREKVRGAIESEFDRTDPRLRFVFNPLYREGRMSSVAAAVKVLGEECGAAMFLRGDQPWISPSLIGDLVRAYRENEAPLAFPVFNGSKGSPTVVGKEHFHDLLALSGDHGTLELAREYWDSSAKLDVDDPRCLRGIDTPEDLQELGF